jgi:hypothetical protein
MQNPTYRRLRKVRYRLLGSRCVNCGQLIFPLRLYCGSCGLLPDRETSWSIAAEASPWEADIQITEVLARTLHHNG